MPLIAGAIVVALLLAGTGILLTRGDESTTADVGSDATAEAEVTWTAEPFTGGPRLAVATTRVDRGSVDYGEEVAAVYRLKNVGDAPLQLGEIDVKTLEGC
jgi:hypothetical protein